jgi:hypothetical protein
MRIGSILLSTLLALTACDGGETKPNGEDTDQTAADTDATGDDTETTPDTEATDDSEVESTVDALGLDGTWGGSLDVTSHSEGSLHGNLINSTSRCETGTVSFSVDVSRNPHVQIESFTCTEVSLGTVTMTGFVSVDGDGAPVLNAGNLAVSGSLSSTSYPAGSVSWTGSFVDDDQDGALDRLQVYAQGVVGVLNTEVGTVVETMTVVVEGARTGD